MKLCPFNNYSDNKECNQECIFYNLDKKYCNIITFLDNEKKLSNDFVIINTGIESLKSSFGNILEKLPELSETTNKTIENNSQELKNISEPLHKHLKNFFNELKLSKENLSELNISISSIKDKFLEFLKNNDPNKTDKLIDFISQMSDNNKTANDSIINSINTFSSENQKNFNSTILDNIDKISTPLDNIISSLNSVNEKLNSFNNKEIIEILNSNSENLSSLNSSLIDTIHESSPIDNLENISTLLSDNISNVSEPLDNIISSLNSVNEKLNSFNNKEIIDTINSNSENLSSLNSSLIDTIRESSPIGKLENISTLLSDNISNIISPLSNIISSLNSVNEKLSSFNNKDIIDTLNSNSENLSSFNNSLIDTIKESSTTTKLDNISNILSDNISSIISPLSNIIFSLNSVNEKLSSFNNKEIINTLNSNSENLSSFNNSLIDTINKSSPIIKLDNISNILSDNISNVSEPLNSIISSLNLITDNFSKLTNENLIEILTKTYDQNVQLNTNVLTKIVSFSEQQNISFSSIFSKNTNIIVDQLENIVSTVSILNNEVNMLKNDDMLDFLKDNKENEKIFSNSIIESINYSATSNKENLIEQFSNQTKSILNILNILINSIKNFSETIISNNNKSIFSNENSLKNLTNKITEKLTQIETNFNINKIIDPIDNIKISNVVNSNKLLDKMTELSNTNVQINKENIDRILKNILPNSKMTINSIFEIKKLIKENLVNFLIEKETRDRDFIKEIIKHWLEAYKFEQNRTNGYLSGFESNFSTLIKNVEEIKNLENLDNFIVNFNNSIKETNKLFFAELKMILENNTKKFVTDFENKLNVISDVLLPLKNIPEMIDNQKIAIDSNIILSKQIGKQSNVFIETNNNLMNYMSQLSENLNNTFKSMNSLTQMQNKFFTDFSKLTDKIEKITSLQEDNMKNEAQRIQMADNLRISNQAKVHNDRGVGFYYSHQYNSALREFKEALKLAPHMYEIHLNMGIILAELGEYKNSKKEFNKVLEIQPDTIEAFINIGLLHLYEKNLIEAEKVLTKAKDISPENSRIYTLIGEIYYEKKDFLNSKKSFEKALKINPLDNDAKIKLKKLNGEDLVE